MGQIRHGHHGGEHSPIIGDALVRLAAVLHSTGNFESCILTIRAHCSTSEASDVRGQ